MKESNKKDYSVHVHFHGTPTPEFIEVFERMLDVAAKFADSEIKNGNLVNEANPKFHKSGCHQPAVDNTKFPPPGGGSAVK